MSTLEVERGADRCRRADPRSSLGSAGRDSKFLRIGLASTRYPLPTKPTRQRGPFTYPQDRPQIIDVPALGAESYPRRPFKPFPRRLWASAIIEPSGLGRCSVVAVLTTKNPRFTGILEPSDGLEPSTPPYHGGLGCGGGSQELRLPPRFPCICAVLFDCYATAFTPLRGSVARKRSISATTVSGSSNHALWPAPATRTK